MPIGGTNQQEYHDQAGFCRAGKLPEIVQNDYVLTPSRYVVVAEEEVVTTEPYDLKM